MTSSTSPSPKFAPLSLDFVSASYISAGNKRLGWLLLLVGLLVLGIGALQLKQAYEIRSLQMQRNAEISARVQSLKSQTVSVRKSKSDASDPQEVARTRAATQAATELQMPWSELLSALETAPTKDIAVLSIEPSAARRSVKLIAEAKHPQAMLSYLAALQKDKRLAQVTLTQHVVQSQTAGTPVRFQLQAYWGGGFAGAPEAAPASFATPQSSNAPMMTQNNSPVLSPAEQNAIANQLGNSTHNSMPSNTANIARNSSSTVGGNQ